VIETTLLRLTTQEDLANTPPTSSIADKLTAVDRIELAVFEHLPFPETSHVVTTLHGGGFKSRQHSRDIAELRACERQITVIRNAGRTVIRAYAEPGPFPRDFEHHLVDALRFVLARRMEVPLVSTRVGGVETVTIHERLGGRWRGGNLHAPLDRGVALSEQHVWRLFDHYPRYVTATPGDAPHSLSATWSGVLRASAGSVETAALVYSVAVESLLRLVPGTRDRRVAADVALDECRTRLLAVLSNDPAPEAVKKRLKGLLDNASQLRPADDLRALADAGAVTPALVKVWHDVRRSTAHGGTPVDVNELPEQLAVLVEQVATLLYELVFHLVGYEGLYTSYADGEGRVRPYPPSPLNADAARPSADSTTRA
jgi:hypothetical protein